MSNASTAIAAPATRAQLSAISESDLSGLIPFLARQSGKSQDQLRTHIPWLLLDNPARQPNTPLGWGLRSNNGEFVGCILCLPQFFMLGERKVLLMGSSSFYVDESHRGQGALIFLKYSQLCSKWPLFGNSANAEAASLWRARRATPIINSDHELLGVFRWRSLIQEFLVRKRGGHSPHQGVARALARAAGPFHRLQLKRSGNLVPLKSADEVMRLPIHDTAEKLTAVRDESFIQWRYFSGNDPTCAVFAYQSQDQFVLVTTNRRQRGYGGQIRALNVLDIYPEVSAPACLGILACLRERYEHEVDCVVMRSQTGPMQSELCRAGFLRRAFAAPNGWLIDRNRLLCGRDFYFAPADGDWLV